MNAQLAIGWNRRRHFDVNPDAKLISSKLFLSVFERPSRYMLLNQAQFCIARMPPNPQEFSGHPATILDTVPAFITPFKLAFKLRSTMSQSHVHLFHSAPSHSFGQLNTIRVCPPPPIPPRNPKDVRCHTTSPKLHCPRRFVLGWSIHNARHHEALNYSKSRSGSRGVNHASSTISRLFFR